MLTSTQQTLNKTCLIGLSYFDAQQNLLKQSMLAGTVKTVDKEIGITIELFQPKELDMGINTKPVQFILPGNLSCWFHAPKGDFHTSIDKVNISNPDYLVTWDIYQTKSASGIDKNIEGKPVDGEQQWWKWLPRTQPPQIG